MEHLAPSGATHGHAPRVPIPPPLPSSSSPPGFAAQSNLIAEPGSSYLGEPASRIEQKQDTLRDVRDDLVGARFRLRSKRRELRNAREAAGSRAGSAFSNIQQYLLQQDIHLPGAMETVFAEASTMRDELGQLDTEYDEAENEYNFLEWKYTNTETLFVDEFGGSPADALETKQLEEVEQAHNDSELQDLMQFSSGLFDTVVPPPPWYKDDEIWNDESVLRVPPLRVWPVEEQEYRILPTRPEDLPVSLSDIVNNTTASKDLQSSSRSFSEGDLGQAQSTWSRTCERVDFWLLEVLASSPSQKARLRALLLGDDLNDDTWWQLVKQHWATPILKDYILHTGDSTISTAEATQPMSVSMELSKPDASLSGSIMDDVGTREMLFSHDMQGDDMSHRSFPTILVATDFVESASALKTPKDNIQGTRQEQEQDIADSIIRVSEDKTFPGAESSKERGEREDCGTPSLSESGLYNAQTASDNDFSPAVITAEPERNFKLLHVRVVTCAQDALRL